MKTVPARWLIVLGLFCSQAVWATESSSGVVSETFERVGTLLQDFELRGAHLDAKVSQLWEKAAKAADRYRAANVRGDTAEMNRARNNFLLAWAEETLILQRMLKDAHAVHLDAREDLEKLAPHLLWRIEFEQGEKEQVALLAQSYLLFGSRIKRMLVYFDSPVKIIDALSERLEILARPQRVSYQPQKILRMAKAYLETLDSAFDFLRQASPCFDGGVGAKIKETGGKCPFLGAEGWVRGSGFSSLK